MKCVNYNFLAGVFSNCNITCKACYDFDSQTDSLIVNHQKLIENSCKICNKCTTDWNIRAALDGSGMTLIGLALFSLFLFYKNYSFEELLEGIDSINLFGVLGLKLEKIEQAAINIEQKGLDDIDTSGLKQEAFDIYEEIYKKSSSSSNTVQLFLDKIEELENEINIALKKHYNVPIIFDKDKQYLHSLRDVMGSFIDYLKQDKKNKNFNSIVSLAKKLILMLLNLTKRISKKLQKSDQTRYLKSSIGIGCIDNFNKKILFKGATIPMGNYDYFYTIEDDQKSMSSPILIGESDTASNCVEIDNIELDKIPLKPAGKVSTLITLKIDKFGILYIHQICEENNNETSKSIDINQYLIEK